MLMKTPYNSLVDYAGIAKLGSVLISGTLSKTLYVAASSYYFKQPYIMFCGHFLISTLESTSGSLQLKLNVKRNYYLAMV